MQPIIAVFHLLRHASFCRGVREMEGEIELDTRRAEQQLPLHPEWIMPHAIGHCGLVLKPDPCHRFCDSVDPRASFREKEESRQRKFDDEGNAWRMPQWKASATWPKTTRLACPNSNATMGKGSVGLISHPLPRTHLPVFCFHLHLPLRGRLALLRQNKKFKRHALAHKSGLGPVHSLSLVDFPHLEFQLTQVNSGFIIIIKLVV